MGRCLGFFLLLLTVENAVSADWVRAGISTNQPVWGLRGGLQWALPPGGFTVRGGGPRGLIRVGYPTLTNGEYELINFIAIEPVVKGHRGFSELEQSQLDHQQGKRLSALENAKWSPGKISHPAAGVEQLDVPVKVEPFENGAELHLSISQRSNAPDEMRITIHAEKESAPLEYCILTATMGNRERTRLLWLKNEVVSSLKLYPDHHGEGFAPHTIYPLDKLPQNSNGDIIAAITTDEKNPAAAFPFPGTRRWHYAGFPVTQYWRRSGAIHDDLQCAVNARATYWMTSQPIPGGVAFENFELRERYYKGQQFIFGITKRTPAELGIVY